MLYPLFDLTGGWYRFFVLVAKSMLSLVGWLKTSSLFASLLDVENVLRKSICEETKNG